MSALGKKNEHRRTQLDPSAVFAVDSQVSPDPLLLSPSWLNWFDKSVTSYGMKRIKNRDFHKFQRYLKEDNADLSRSVLVDRSSGISDSFDLHLSRAGFLDEPVK